jgi:hypothetical protein
MRQIETKPNFLFENTKYILKIETISIVVVVLGKEKRWPALIRLVDWTKLPIAILFNHFLAN